MKKTAFSFMLAFGAFAFAAKADIIIVYKCGKETCAPIKKTKLACKDFVFEPIVIECHDIKPASKIGNGSIQNGVLSAEDGTILGTTKETDPENEGIIKEDFIIQECVLTADGRLMVGEVLLGTTTAKE
jgi:hypothetical protein